MIIAIANQKGGVGKTTLTVHLGAWLAARGRKVCVVDADPQANCTSWIMGSLDRSAVYDVLVAGAALDSVMTRVPAPWSVALLQATQQTGDAYTVLAALGKGYDTISMALRPLGEVYDYVLLDMPPSRTACFDQLLYVADLLLIPTTLERLGIEGVALMARSIRDMKSQGERWPRLLGIVPNMVRRTNEHREQMRVLLAEYGEAVWPPIPQAIAMTEACSFGETIWQHAPRTLVASRCSLMCRRFVENVR